MGEAYAQQWTAQIFVMYVPKGIVWRRCGGCARRRRGRDRRGRAAALPAVLRFEPLGVYGAQGLHEVVVQRHAPRRTPLRALRAAASATRWTALCLYKQTFKWLTVFGGCHSRPTHINRITDKEVYVCSQHAGWGELGEANQWSALWSRCPHYFGSLNEFMRVKVRYLLYCITAGKRLCCFSFMISWIGWEQHL